MSLGLPSSAPWERFRKRRTAISAEPLFRAQSEGDLFKSHAVGELTRVQISSEKVRAPRPTSHFDETTIVEKLKVPPRLHISICAATAV